MHRCDVLRHAAVFGAVATASFFALGHVHAQTAGLVATPAAPPLSASARAAPPPPICVIGTDQSRFDFPLPRTARKLVSGRPIKIVALGSSSTYGAGATTPATTYPSRLAAELAEHFPGHEISVLNRGVSGEELPDMLARLDISVIAEQPDLVLWQLGTNSVLRDKALQPHVALLHEGLARLKATGADIVLIDPQYAPRVIAKPATKGMVALIATTAKAEHVCLFHRFDLMRYWFETEHFKFETFVSADGLHMNDWSYACLAKALGAAIAEAATRPTTTATGPRVAR